MNDWDWRVPVVVRQMPREKRITEFSRTAPHMMQNGQEGRFCDMCGRLAFCPQCNADLRGKTKCHRAMSTHYRDEECTFNPNWMTEYKRKESK